MPEEFYSVQAAPFTLILNCGKQLIVVYFSSRRSIKMLYTHEGKSWNMPARKF